MSRECRQCGKKIPYSVLVNGVRKNIQNRKFCIDCSPWGHHNTSPTKPFSNLIIGDGVLEKEKNCPICGVRITASKNNGYRKKDKKSNKYRMHSYCKKCVNEYSMARWAMKKIEYVSKKGWICHDCGLKDAHPVEYDFHHLDPTKKEGVFTKIRLWSKERADKEIDKCILLCSGCHRKRHIDKGYWEKLLKDFKEKQENCLTSEN